MQQWIVVSIVVSSARCVVALSLDSIMSLSRYLFSYKPCLRTFARNFSNIDFFLKILPLKDDELAMSEM